MFVICVCVCGCVVCVYEVRECFVTLTLNTTTLKPSGHYMYRQFNIQQFYALPTQCIYVFCVDLRTNCGYFTVQH